MKFSVSYNKETDDIKLNPGDEPLDFAHMMIYIEAIKELQYFKDNLSADFEADIEIDEINKTIVLRSKLTDAVFQYHYKYMDGLEICDFLHELAIMEDSWIFLEEFDPSIDITLSYDEIIPVDVDE